ncbi:hypothetical protein [Novipirellula artificiosorum]|uniref:Sulfatase n=1 Tax=Novipirellula artificiosorum TaxID=2528016 RepID=A0A5C6DSM4_9BACT|nr:hypothetical protein [Novipirellula artificiosorum]TWU38491.1 Sulfatase [Novipirellula artificiosorum]
MTEKKMIVISAEGLATAALGCFGSSWNPTPAIDRIASEGSVWEQMIAGSHSPTEVLRNWWCGTETAETGEIARSVDWFSAWRERGPIELITDCPDVSKSGIDAPFTVSTLIEPPSFHAEGAPVRQPCEEIEETHLAELFAALLDRIESEAPWSSVWLHTQSLAGCWDAPRWLVPRDETDFNDGADLDDEEDPTDKGQPAPPWMFDLVDISPFPLPEDAHPDLVVSWMRTYGCQIQLLDRLIGLLLESLAEKAEAVTIVIVGASGFSLGQNGWIGTESGPLRSCHHRIPLLIQQATAGSKSEMFGGPIRSAVVANASELPRLLRQLCQSDGPLISPSQWAQDSDDFHPYVITQSDSSMTAITTARWYLVQDQQEGGPKLFLKPDDVDDQNNVSRLRPDITAQLEELIRSELR